MSPERSRCGRARGTRDRSMRLEIVCTPFGVATLVALAVACSDTQGSLDPRSVDHLASSDWRNEQRLEASDAAEFDQLGALIAKLGPQ